MSQDVFVAVGSLGLLCLLSGLLTWIDIRQGIIPDWLNLSIGGLGFVRVTIIDGLPAGIEAACAGVATGAVFWLLRRLYFRVRHIQGLGLGDVKFLAAAGLWVGATGLPMLLLVAALTALVSAGVMRFSGQTLHHQASMPFGPFLALGLLVTVVAQQNGMWL